MDSRRKKKRLGDMLIEECIITQDQLEQALKTQQKQHQRLGVILVDLGFTDEMTIAKTLTQQLNLDYIQLSGIFIDPLIVGLVNEQILRKHIVIPFEFSKSDSDTLRVAMADPMELTAIDDLTFITNYKIEPVIATHGDISATIDRYYGSAEAKAVAERYSREKELQEKEDELVTSDSINSSPIVLLVKTTIEQAIRQRASDIHIEPLEKQVRVRYRVDGALYEINKYNKDLLPAIVARIKIISGMDISEKRNPQDGRISMVVDRQEYDIRVSSLPTVHGEKIVMRINAKKQLMRSKKELGLTDSDMRKFDAILRQPHGIILVTGPTGSGKSTTLYTALSEINTKDVNIITVEDPVEATIDGINQIQVNPKAKLTFASALRSILRQDPNIIMIGEIRDGETAEIAVRASITGHLVVSTIHTNSAASSVTRLLDMGIESYLLADSLIGVISQRLIRKLCNKCKTKRKATIEDKKLLEQDPDEALYIYEPKGCPLCNNTGYLGRTGVYEIMTISPAIKLIISHKGNTAEIHEMAMEEGMNSLKMSAIQYVLDGTTSIIELNKIIYEE
ncbi:MAG: Flp pilus assembly complex ATPase component TadA [Clostridiales bacterium]|jgi:type IV pilus assembly protein PilB|nr:Flp pilus assembly complex ATPase component TadA [Clostridiales bacterium]